MRNYLRPAIVLLLAMTFLTGVVYPAVVTLIAQTCFNRQAEGSLIMQDGKPVASELIGQPFTRPDYFWPRPSATNDADGKPLPYNAAAGSGSNQSQSNPALIDAVKDRIKAMKEADPENNAPIPIDLVTASASGLDPHISLAAAKYQVPRIARLRHRNAAEIEMLVARFTEERTLGIFGEPRVNVVKLNLALDKP
jgi:K+-transporting ATPase ATPase C chain